MLQHIVWERIVYIYIYIFQVCLCAFQLKPMTLNLIFVAINSKSFTYKCQTVAVWHIIFALINGLHNNKLETGVVQLFELIKITACSRFSNFPKSRNCWFQVWEWGIGRSGLQNQRSIGSGYFKNIRKMAVSKKNLVNTLQL